MSYFDKNLKALGEKQPEIVELMREEIDTSHIEIITKTKNIEERIFYITKTAKEFWSVRTLKQHLKNKLFEKQATLPNNFEKTIITEKQQQKGSIS